MKKYADGSYALIAGKGEGASDARLAGRLAIGPGGCIGVDVGGRTVLVAFPTGSVGESKFDVKVDGDSLTVGDRVELTGGSVEAPFPARVPEPPARCIDNSTTSEVFVAN